MRKPTFLFICFLLLTSFTKTVAQDSYYYIPLTEFYSWEKLFPKGEPKKESWWIPWSYREAFAPYVVLDTPGEAYISAPKIFGYYNESQKENSYYGALIVRAPKDQEISGTFFYPVRNWNKMNRFTFKVNPSQANPEAEKQFYRSKYEHYEKLMSREIPGGAWFRFQSRQAAEKYKQLTKIDLANNQLNRWNSWNRTNDLSNTYNLFSGGRAMSENLQLDRMLRPDTSGSARTVDIRTLGGITIATIDWKPLLKETRPEVDPLAANIPHDQHALFFFSFQKMLDTTDELNKSGTPLMQMMNTRSENANIHKKYEEQLCLERDAMSRIFGPSVIASVAITGSGPYLMTGADLAVLFEAKNPALLETNLLAKHIRAKSKNSEAKEIQGELQGFTYKGLVSPDRKICSYISVLGNVVVVTNSLVQLEAIINTTQKKLASMLSLDEYIFFRQRYIRTQEESAFLVITDPAIRKWCSAKWRIGSSRRTRAAALMSDLQAKNFESLATSNVAAGQPLETTLTVPEIGELILTPTGVRSSTYNNLEFMTPIAELSIERVTLAEAEAYENFRSMYQRSWRRFFDPIALKIVLTPEEVQTDITVMPLILGSDYREFVEIAGDALLKANSGDPHKSSILHFALALDPDSRLMQEAKRFLLQGSQDWIGSSFSIYVDESPFWAEAAQASNISKFMEENIGKMPFAFFIETKNAAALNTYMQNVIPAAISNEKLKSHIYKEQFYYSFPEKWLSRSNETTIWYCASKTGFMVSFSEKLIKNFLDREAALKETQTTDVKNPWLGESLSLNLEQTFLMILKELSKKEYQTTMQLRSWSNLAILNEWKKQYPEINPVELHKIFWQVELTCPASGEYVWNAEWNTMESTIFGHPGNPKFPAALNSPLDLFQKIQFGLKFEHDGLRGKVTLKRK